MDQLVGIMSVQQTARPAREKERRERVRECRGWPRSDEQPQSAAPALLSILQGAPPLVTRHKNAAC